MSVDIDCALLERARQVAQKRGLPAGLIKCQNTNICDGMDCKAIDQPQTRHITLRPQIGAQPKNPVEAFYDRLQKHLQR